MSLSVAPLEKITNDYDDYPILALIQDRAWKRVRSRVLQPGYHLLVYELHLQKTLNANFISRYQAQDEDIMTGG